MRNWHSLVYTGDQWLLAYACIPVCAQNVALFSVGHALELYLKATHAKMFGDFNRAIAFGHGIKPLWDACKESDGSWLPDHELREAVYSVDFLVAETRGTLSREDQLHYAEYQSLYAVAKHLQDLKYLGLPWKTRKAGGTTFMAWASRDPYWIVLFRDMRKYLGYPAHGMADFIEQQLSFGQVPDNAAHYLAGLYVAE